MTTHLTQDQLLACAEAGSMPPDAARHLDACAVCRREVDSLRALVGDLKLAEAPEPSPLFWDHFSARVARAVRETPGADTGGRVEAPTWRPWARWRWALGTVTALAGLVLVVTTVGPMRPSGTPTPAAPAVATVAVPGATAALSTPDGEDWSLLTEAMDELDYDEVRAIGATLAGPAELAVRDLDADEQRELARLLREEIERLSPGALETL